MRRVEQQPLKATSPVARNVGSARFRPAVLMGRLSEIRLWNESHSTGMIKSTVLTSHVSRLRFAPLTEFAQSSHEQADIYPPAPGGRLLAVTNS